MVTIKNIDNMDYIYCATCKRARHELLWVMGKEMFLRCLSCGYSLVLVLDENIIPSKKPIKPKITIKKARGYLG